METRYIRLLNGPQGLYAESMWYRKWHHALQLGYVFFSGFVLTLLLFHDQFVHGNHKAQKYLLGAFELLVGQSFPAELMPKAAHILKAFYDHDLLEEEVILQWSEKVRWSSILFL